MFSLYTDICGVFLKSLPNPVIPTIWAEDSVCQYLGSLLSPMPPMRQLFPLLHTGLGVWPHLVVWDEPSLDVSTWDCPSASYKILGGVLALVQRMGGW